jgi:hypothetical protein
VFPWLGNREALWISQRVKFEHARRLSAVHPYSLLKRGGRRFPPPSVLRSGSTGRVADEGRPRIPEAIRMIKRQAPTFTYKGTLPRSTRGPPSMCRLTSHARASLADPSRVREGGDDTSRVLRTLDYEDLAAKADQLRGLIALNGLMHAKGSARSTLVGATWSSRGAPDVHRRSQDRGRRLKTTRDRFRRSSVETPDRQ